MTAWLYRLFGIARSERCFRADEIGTQLSVGVGIGTGVAFVETSTLSIGFRRFENVPIKGRCDCINVYALPLPEHAQTPTSVESRSPE